MNFHITPLEFSFYFFSVVMLLSTIMVVTLKNPVKCALFLVLTFFSATCLWITLEAEFLAIVLLLVYVGAVMVLFLFVVMMLDINIEKIKAGFTKYLPIGILVAFLLITETAIIIYSSFNEKSFSHPPLHGEKYSNTRELGETIYTQYIYPFEIGSLILLVSIISAIVLTIRHRSKRRKYVNPREQIQVKREDRLRMVKVLTSGRSKMSNSSAKK